MAAHLLKHLARNRIYVESAGVRPGAPDPFAVAVMEEIGIDMSAHVPKSIGDLHDLSFDLIVTLAPEAQHKALELAHRENVTVYTIGIDLKKASAGRRRLTQLAEETGGSSFFIETVAELASIYQRIEKEIRSQYLIAYQSSHGTADDGFRLVDVKVRSGGEARTLRGYYP